MPPAESLREAVHQFRLLEAHGISKLAERGYPVAYAHGQMLDAYHYFLMQQRPVGIVEREPKLSLDGNDDPGCAEESDVARDLGRGLEDPPSAEPLRAVIALQLTSRAVHDQLGGEDLLDVMAKYEPEPLW